MRAKTLMFLFTLGTTAAAWGAGCSNDDPGATPESDGGPDGLVPDASTDVVTDSGIVDCANDEDLDGLKRHLQCADLYSNIATKTLAPQNRAYKPGAEFWSDGAIKSRYVNLPAGAKIDITSFDEWVFPNGTKLWKEFSIGGKRIETRLYAKNNTGEWNHTTYRWNANESDAVRFDTGDVLMGLGPDGGRYEIPNSGQCTECHSNRTDKLLGFDAIGLGLPGATGVTLAVLASEDRFSTTPPATALTVPVDPLAPTSGQAAVIWMHTNCGGCHNGVGDNGGGLTGFHMQIRPSQLVGGGTFASLDAVTTGVCCLSGRVNPDGGTYARIAPQNPNNSLAAVLSGARSQGQFPSSGEQMPPLVTRAVDREGHQLLLNWIAERPACANVVCP